MLLISNRPGQRFCPNLCKQTMTNFDSVKNQYRALYRDMAFKRQAHHMYEIKGRFLLLPELHNLAVVEPTLKNVQNMTETRLLSIMQELAAEAV